VPAAFAHRFAHLGAEEAPVAGYLSDVAAANILWPIGERGLGKRLHRVAMPRLTLWGDLDEVNPVSNAAAWGGAQILAGAGHLVEWDAPDQVSAALLDFLSSLSG
jgi:pimeloyl-ACP methyl ester carboxylesterase